MHSDRLMDALGRLYAATIAPDTIGAALNAIADVFEAREACLISVDKLNNRNDILDTGYRLYTPDAHRAYGAHYVQVDDVRFELERSPVGSVFNDADHFSDDRVARSEFYQDFLGPRGARYILSTNLINDRRQIAGLSLHRAPETGAFTKTEALLMAHAVPHLQRIARLRVRLSDLESRYRRSTAVLDGLTFGLACTDEKGRLVLTNACFERALALKDGLTVRNQMLQAATTAATARLAEVITDAARASAGKGSPSPGAGLRMARPSGRRPWALVVAPLPARSALAHRESPGALIVLTDPETARATPVLQLVELFGLTRGEARLVERLLQVDSLATAAEMNRITIGTARHVLKQVFHKTDSHSQSELVKRVLQSPIGQIEEE
ncbi:MAG: helix-turn-helix transcriptional regulator [Alphaproteobacteria bacterium]